MSMSGQDASFDPTVNDDHTESLSSHSESPNPAGKNSDISPRPPAQRSPTHDSSSLPSSNELWKVALRSQSRAPRTQVVVVVGPPG